MHGRTPLPSSRLILISPNGERQDLELWRDYVVSDARGGPYLPLPVDMVFAGYGIVAPEFDHNDYQDIDLVDRVAVILAGEPPSDDPSYFAGPRPTIHSDPEMKFRVARSRGAKATILLPLPREKTYTSWERALGDYQNEDISLLYGVAGSVDLLLRNESAPALFTGSDWTWEQILERDRRGEAHSFPLATRLVYTGDFQERDFVSANLVARLPGGDPLLRSEAVIVSAHYDHLGVGRPFPAQDRGGSEDDIYNGVIDNASGTAVVLELARVLAARPERPRRSILFLFVTGEDKGVLGSRFYCDHPRVPLHQTVAAINVDGISFLDTNDEFVGVGAEYSTLGQLLATTLSDLGLRLGEIPAPFESARHPFYTSDQLAFAQASIPAILVMEGFAFRNLTAEQGLRRFLDWGRQRYHTPFDDLKQPIDPAAVAQHTEVLLRYVTAVADTPREPRWLPGVAWIGERLHSLAEGR